jgi:excisionase family DNA binding protein
MQRDASRTNMDRGLSAAALSDLELLTRSMPRVDRWCKLGLLGRISEFHRVPRNSTNALSPSTPEPAKERVAQNRAAYARRKLRGQRQCRLASSLQQQIRKWLDAVCLWLRWLDAISIHRVKAIQPEASMSLIPEPLPHLRFEIIEAARILRMSRATLYERIRSGDLKAQRDGRRRYITAEELHRYIGSKT